jgi:hypothetical protein
MEMQHGQVLYMLHVQVQVHAVSPCKRCMDVCAARLNVHSACPYCMSMSMLEFHVCAPCPCLWCMSRSVLQIHVHAAVNVHAASPCPCYKSMSVLYVHVHEAQKRACSMCMETKHVLGDAMGMNLAWTWICNIDIDMQHGHEQGHAACNTCPWCMSMSMLPVNVPAVWQCPCCMSLSTLLVQIHAARTWI